jgi:hypothetical protein
MSAVDGVVPAAENVRKRARWAGWIALAVAGLKEIGPYAAIEIILPGGTLIALLLWLYRRRNAARSLATLSAAVSPARGMCGQH